MSKKIVELPPEQLLEAIKATQNEDFEWLHNSAKTHAVVNFVNVFKIYPENFEIKHLQKLLEFIDHDRSRVKGFTDLKSWDAIKLNFIEAAARLGFSESDLGVDAMEMKRLHKLPGTDPGERQLLELHRRMSQTKNFSHE